MLDAADCIALAVILRGLRFKKGDPRKELLTAPQVVAIRAMANDMGLHSLALAQALQFECKLRQKDVIGEIVPKSEPGESDICVGDMKWHRGLRWSEIDRDSILRHVTAREGRSIEIDLKQCPMVMEELRRFGENQADGPVVVYEGTGEPYQTHTFRRVWRQIANAAGVPKTVHNMDSKQSLADRKSASTFNQIISAYQSALEKIATKTPCATVEAMSRVATDALARARTASQSEF